MDNNNTHVIGSPAIKSRLHQHAAAVRGMRRRRFKNVLHIFVVYHPPQPIGAEQHGIARDNWKC